MNIIKRDGSSEPFDFAKIERLNEFATAGLNVDGALLRSQIRFQVYDGMSTRDIFRAQISAAAGLISVDNPDMTFVAARYLLADLLKEVGGSSEYFPLSESIRNSIAAGRLKPDLANKFDLHYLDSAIQPERDLQFDYMGLQAVVDRYVLRDFNDKILELPQHFLMRVAMGVALGVPGKLDQLARSVKAVSYYEILSTFRFMSSTPTLFNAGSLRSQLSSCYLNTVADQISAGDDENRFASIYGTIEECARLSKHAGGIGTSWTRVRGAGSLIKGTNGKSAGIVPHLKVYNDTALAVNQGGKRKGSFAPYLEPWHPDFMEFCDLKKEFGDDRMRAHDVFPAAWVPDLFMERVINDGVWSFFEPNKFPELHELWGIDFDLRYEQLEREGKFVKQLPAKQVWQHLLTNLFTTGHPWVTFKDECNRRSPQQHVGVVHSSNLCTEITLNTSDTETAVCNLGSVNLARHIDADGEIDFRLLRDTVRTAVEMLDNVIDVNYYPSDRARDSNMRHRPIGLGAMGYTDAMVAAGIDWESEAHLDWADVVFEHLSFYAIEASSDLAVVRGTYESFEGSLWSKGVLPIDTAANQDATMSWDTLRAKVKRQGMRNSNVMAIAPTATISTLVGVEPCIEPIFEVSRGEKNISGAFQVVSPCVRYGKPELLKTAFEIDQRWVIRAAGRRGKWIDQSQSVNIFAKKGTRGRDLDELYKLAYTERLKTTYYLRTQSSTDKKDAPAPTPAAPEPVELCSIDNPSCEACQ